MWAPELETLDQLLGGDLPVTVIAKLYSTPECFRKGILGLLSSGDVVLLDANDNAVPEWRCKEIFTYRFDTEQLDNFRVRVTPQGAKRVG
jgi:dihydroxyacid dehydratase/phosphogluconate dehydratase